MLLRNSKTSFNRLKPTQTISKTSARGTTDSNRQQDKQGFNQRQTRVVRTTF